MEKYQDMPDVQEYIQSLTPIEKQAMETALKLLGMTFDIKKSNGFLKWKSKQ